MRRRGISLLVLRIMGFSVRGILGSVGSWFCERDICFRKGKVDLYTCLCWYLSTFFFSFFLSFVFKCYIEISIYMNMFWWPWEVCMMYDVRPVDLGRADVSSWNKVSGSTLVGILVTWHGICIELRHIPGNSIAVIVSYCLCRWSGQRDYKEQVLSYKCLCYFSLLSQEKVFSTLLLCMINIPNGE